GLFTAAAGASDVVTRHGVYGVRATKGQSPEELWLGIQERMGALEGEVASSQEGAELVIVDGPLSHRRHVERAVGYVKREHVEYLPAELWDVKYGLAVGRRTPLFLTSGAWSRYSWYVRLALGQGPAEGLVRCEVSADMDVASAATLADRVTATLPRYGSAPHKDPRAPENLYPIAGLEREMRRRLGEPNLMYRALRVAAAAAV
ncbi:MAG: DNA double-strand break repair nuclease NurA, partial [Acidimicrobiia bacterium]